MTDSIQHQDTFPTEIEPDGRLKEAHLYRNEEEIAAGNRLLLVRKDGTEEEIESFSKLTLNFKGQHGLVRMHESVKIKKQLNLIVGENCFISLGENVSATNCFIDMSAERSTVIVGNRSWLRTLRCFLNTEPGLEVIMGQDCIMSLGVMFKAGREHSIIDMMSGKLLFPSRFGIHIADHVWFGQSVTILKDAYIPRHCIIGARAVVGEEVFVPNSIIAGYPARVLKYGVNWDKRRIHQYLA